MRFTRTRNMTAAAALAVVTVTAAGASLANAGTHTAAARSGDVTTGGELRPLNNAAGSGQAMVVISGRDLNVVLHARRLLKNMPHAMHIHFGATARHECPTVRDDSNSDHRLSTAEGTPAYGPVRVSLTKRGDTSPDSTLAVTRFPTAPRGTISYARTIRVGSRLAEKIAEGKGVIVIHGIDYNHNGKYDFRGAGRSELDPKLPAEATDPVVCGRMRVTNQSSTTSNSNILTQLLGTLLP